MEILSAALYFNFARGVRGSGGSRAGLLLKLFDADLHQASVAKRNHNGTGAENVPQFTDVAEHQK